MTASKAALSRMRDLSEEILLAYGAAAKVASTTQLVLSELVGNAVRACGDAVPLVIEVYVADSLVAVSVHDPEPELLPQPGKAAMDDPEAESGRGLVLLNVLCHEVSVIPSAIGKQVRCLLAPA
ncbi:ATP-binding protein [Streptomyces sp. NPDC090741]|uniref:ATP-binding protein n=1 Tax=Streptomyces sp. NPDC090741 TaxID=3365967 RepID=UPI0037FCDA4C